MVEQEDVVMGSIYICGEKWKVKYTLMKKTPGFEDVEVGETLEIVRPLETLRVISKTDKFISAAYLDEGTFNVVVYRRDDKKMIEADEIIVSDNSLLKKKLDKIWS